MKRAILGAAIAESHDDSRDSEEARAPRLIRRGRLSQHQFQTDDYRETEPGLLSSRDMNKAHLKGEPYSLGKKNMGDCVKLDPAPNVHKIFL